MSRHLCLEVDPPNQTVAAVLARYNKSGGTRLVNVRTPWQKQVLRSIRKAVPSAPHCMSNHMHDCYLFVHNRALSITTHENTHLAIYRLHIRILNCFDNGFELPKNRLFERTLRYCSEESSEMLRDAILQDASGYAQACVKQDVARIGEQWTKLVDDVARGERNWHERILPNVLFWKGDSEMHLAEAQSAASFLAADWVELEKLTPKYVEMLLTVKF